MAWFQGRNLMSSVYNSRTRSLTHIRSNPEPTTHQDIYSQVMLDWNIPAANWHKLSEHFLRLWSSSYYLSTYGAHVPIKKDDVIYLVIYHRCVATDLAKANIPLLLSFRRIAGMKYGYCLVTPSKTHTLDDIATIA